MAAGPEEDAGGSPSSSACVAARRSYPDPLAFIASGAACQLPGLHHVRARKSATWVGESCKDDKESVVTLDTFYSRLTRAIAYVQTCSTWSKAAGPGSEVLGATVEHHSSECLPLEPMCCRSQSHLLNPRDPCASRLNSLAMLHSSAQVECEARPLHGSSEIQGT